MVEKNIVSLTDRIDVDIVLRILRMRNKGLHKEIGQVALNVLDLKLTCKSGAMGYLLEFASAFLNPFSAFFPPFVETQKAALSSSLDQHVWFRNEFSAIFDPRACNLHTVENFFDVGSIILRRN